MPASPHVTVTIDLGRVRENAITVRARAGVPVLAVVKADGYGLGAARVIAAIDEVVDGYCFFSLAEAAAAGLREITVKPALAFGPPGAFGPSDYRSLGVPPVVSTASDAGRYREADPVLSVDTGQQRFACPPAEFDAALREGRCREAMTHALTAAQVERFVAVAGGRGLRLHAAGSSLLDDPAARLDAVRPGIALYRGATRVSTPLVEVRDSAGPAGYTGFAVPRHGVILCGYSNGLRAGPCLVGGSPSRVLEVGMQSAFVECAPGDRAGDEVVLLGDGLREEDVAWEWRASQHVVLTQLAGSGQRTHRGP